MSPAEQGPGAAIPEAVRGEIGDFVRSHEERNRQLPRAALVGLLAGLIGVAFRWTVERGDALRDACVLWARQSSLGPLPPALFGAVGALVAVRLVRALAPETAGSGIPHLEAVLHRLASIQYRRLLPVKFFAGAIAMTGGLALGREGPTVQMGGGVGAAVSAWVGATPRERQTLIAAGAGAGLAAAFNAPLAGVVFVLEEVQRHFSPTVFAASFLAAVIADVVARSMMGQLPVFHVAAFPLPPLTTLPAFFVLGLLAGVLGVAFNRALLGSLNLFSGAKRWPIGVPAAFVGAAAGVLAWFSLPLAGGGHRLVQRVLTGDLLPLLIPLWFVARFGLTVMSYGCGAPGGIFAPLLVLGALIGLEVGRGMEWLAPAAVTHPEAFAVVGMGAYFAAVVRAPLTGIVLIVEMTNNYQQMLPLLVACLTAYAVADLMGDRPIYEALLERDLMRSHEPPTLAETLLIELPVQAGAPFEGRRVRDIGLPPGCVLVRLRRGVEESVPMADTRLQGGDWITAVVAPKAAAAMALLHEGCGVRE